MQFVRVCWRSTACDSSPTNCAPNPHHAFDANFFLVMRATLDHKCWPLGEESLLARWIRPCPLVTFLLFPCCPFSFFLSCSLRSHQIATASPPPIMVSEAIIMSDTHHRDNASWCKRCCLCASGRGCNMAATSLPAGVSATLALVPRHGDIPPTMMRCPSSPLWRVSQAQ